MILMKVTSNMSSRNKFKKFKNKVTKGGFRSSFESKIAKDLKNSNIKYKYEDKLSKISYIKPQTISTYLPDFILENGIIIEVKGMFTLIDRKKHALINSQHPNLDIRFVFMRPKNTIYKGSKTTYSDWCDKLGIPWCGPKIPKEWLQ